MGVNSDIIYSNPLDVNLNSNSKEIDMERLSEESFESLIVNDIK